MAPGEPDPSLAWVDAITGAEVDESAVVHTVHVDPAKGDDATEGTKAKPFRTIAAAAARAAKHLGAGEGVRIHLAAGTYREEVDLKPADTGATLVLEGARPGAVILTGSDDWSDPEAWRPVTGMPGVVGAPWKRDWGDTRVHVSGRPEGDHPPRLCRAAAPDDGTAIIEWQTHPGLKAPAGYRVDRKDATFGAQEAETPWRAVARLGPATGRLVDETVQAARPSEVRLYQYQVVALDANGRERGTSRMVTIEPGAGDGAWRAAVVGRRREMIFVDGNLMRQVTSREGLEPGTFYVDEGLPADADDGRLCLAMPLEAAR
ncbi:MAG: DUF1565 domain-containing protein, partial [Planctomycetota bacterium]|nr:DUF1565 domain-containing protein [Planctomycetota bacterium]